MSAIQLGYTLAGDVLIGTAATLFLWLNGRIAYGSSVIGNLPFAKDRLWHALFNSTEKRIWK